MHLTPILKILATGLISETPKLNPSALWASVGWLINHHAIVSILGWKVPRYRPDRDSSRSKDSRLHKCIALECKQYYHVSTHSNTKGKPGKWWVIKLPAVKMFTNWCGTQFYCTNPAHKQNSIRSEIIWKGIGTTFLDGLNKCVYALIATRVHRKWL